MRRPSVTATIGRASSSSGLAAFSVVAAIALHAVVFAAAWRGHPASAHVVPDEPETVWDLDDLVSPPEPLAAPPPEPEATPIEPRTTAHASDRAPAHDELAEAAPSERAESDAPTPAEAGDVVAAEDVVDFSSFSVVRGRGGSYAGGSTTANGTSREAVRSSAVATSSIPIARVASRASPVRLDAREWRCDIAEGETDDEELFVVLRVEVDARGDVLDARIVGDSHGAVGDKALACARRTRFVPAMSEDGERIAATSPPIHVRLARR